jgi:hypothetical protein
MPKHQLDLFIDYLPRKLFADGVYGQEAFEIVCAANGLEPSYDSEEVWGVRTAIWRILGS